MATILLVEDDVSFCLMLKTWLQKRGFKIQEAFSCRDAFKCLKDQSFDLVLTDMRLPDQDGLFLLNHLKSVQPSTPVILMTGYAEIPTAVQAIKAGAFDYVTKPFLPEQILAKIEDALSLPDADTTHKSTAFHYITGNTPGAIRLADAIRLVAPTRMSVLIRGESGTGKEYIARMIHNESDRKEAPFIAVDCGAIPKELAGSEFFGHIKGSFTGAVNDKAGLFAAASGGTLFLDEIGNLGYEIQVQLLRVLEERKIKPVGSEKEIPVDIRLIAATNENLLQAVNEGRFREDLYHRLNELSLHSLSLRERAEDIPLFARNFLILANEELNRKIEDFQEEVLELFKHYAWPGNLRELRNTVKRATLFCRGSYITLSDLPAELTQQVQNTADKISLRSPEKEEQLIRDALLRTNYNKSEAARQLKIDRKTLYNKIKAYNIQDTPEDN